MERVNLILNHEDYQKYLKFNTNAEADRIYCKHNLEHFIDVARITWITYLEEGNAPNLNVKSKIYAAALFHDIGRFREYQDNIPHQIASAELAEPILKEVGYSKNEIEEIKDMILDHRKKQDYKSHLAEIFANADKLSRKCFICPAINSCNWLQKNDIIIK